MATPTTQCWEPSQSFLPALCIRIRCLEPGLESMGGGVPVSSSVSVTKFSKPCARFVRAHPQVFLPKDLQRMIFPLFLLLHPPRQLVRAVWTEDGRPCPLLGWSIPSKVSSYGDLLFLHGGQAGIWQRVLLYTKRILLGKASRNFIFPGRFQRVLNSQLQRTLLSQFLLSLTFAFGSGQIRFFNLPFYLLQILSGRYLAVCFNLDCSTWEFSAFGITFSS